MVPHGGLYLSSSRRRTGPATNPVAWHQGRIPAFESGPTKLAFKAFDLAMQSDVLCSIVNRAALAFSNRHERTMRQRSNGPTQDEEEPSIEAAYLNRFFGAAFAG